MIWEEATQRAIEEEVLILIFFLILEDSAHLRFVECARMHLVHMLFDGTNACVFLIGVPKGTNVEYPFMGMQQVSLPFGESAI